MQMRFRRSNLAKRQNRIAVSFVCHLPRRESANLFLPLVAEYEDHHLMIDVRVVAQAADRAAARDREHLICSLSLLGEWGQRPDVFRLRFLVMHLDPEFTLVALMFFLL